MRLVLAFALLATTGVVRPCAAAHLVIFEDGRAVPVSGVLPEGDLVRLSLEQGGEVVVPLDRIARVETLPDREPDACAGGEPAIAGESVSGDEVLRVEAELRPNEAWRSVAGPYADLIAGAADRNGIGRALLAALAQVESGFDPRAVSPKGAQGLLQLMPGTARRFGVRDPFDPRENVEGGARYLRWLLDRFDGRLDLALAGYNAGEGAVDRHDAIPPYRETLHYVVNVLRKAASTAGPPSR